MTRRGGCSICRRLGISGLVSPFSDEIHFGERIGVIGPNGSGKSAADPERWPASASRIIGELVVGPRVSPGLFTQIPVTRLICGPGRPRGRPDPRRRWRRPGGDGGAGPLRTGRGRAPPYDVLSGGEKARLEVLVLELEGHNLLLLDEPTDNLDIDSSEALEKLLSTFEGTVVAVSHDRAFLRKMDRFLMVLHDGRVLALPSYDSALDALLDPADAAQMPLVKVL